MSLLQTCPFCGKSNSVNILKCEHCGSILSTDPVAGHFESFDQKVQESLGRWYQLQGVVGRGGMAVVYKAIQLSLNRKVALKVVHENLVHDQEFLNRFLREAKVSASLNHRNIVTVYDVGSVNNIHYIAMEFLSGLTLRDYLKHQNRLNASQSANIIGPIAESLAFIHQFGLVHRDLKPSNIIITHDGRPVLTDFGVVYVSDGNPLSQTGAVLGTPEYMSPEQAEGKIKLDGRSDIFSLGTILYECITGQLPFHSENPLSTIHQVIYEEAPPINRIVSTAPSWIIRLINQCHTKNRDLRIQSAMQVCSALKSQIVTKKVDDQLTQKIKVAPVKILTHTVPIGKPSGRIKKGTTLSPAVNQWQKWQLHILTGGIAVILLILVSTFMKIQRGHNTVTSSTLVSDVLAKNSNSGEKGEEHLSPMVTTGDISDITLNSARINGRVTSSGNYQILSRGFCYNSKTNPTIDNQVFKDGQGSGDFGTVLHSLQQNTTYFVRAFAIIEKDTTYGNQIDFKTLEEKLPFTIKTQSVKLVSQNSVNAVGNITISGDIQISGRGICWSESNLPTISDNFRPSGSGGGSFTENIGNLESGRTFYFRAYATHINGTSYSNTVSLSIPAAIFDGSPSEKQVSVLQQHNMVYVKGNEDQPGFYIGKFEVTQALWRSIMGSNPSQNIGNSNPVENVSLNDIVQFLRSLNQETGLQFALPSTQDWSFAAKGGNSGHGYTYSGSNSINQVSVYFQNSENQTQPIGSKSGNELGLFDMSGNVWEWCSNGTVKGGCWMSTGDKCRISSSQNMSPETRDFCVGFRLYHPERLIN